MHRAPILVWGLTFAAMLDLGCGRLARKKEPAQPEAEEAGAEAAPAAEPRLLPTGRNDGVTPKELIRGKVTGVDKMLGLVVINVGEKQGVKPRYGFTVCRGEKFVGRIVVEEVLPDASIARYGRTMKINVEVGDEVTTKLLTDI